jgi:thiol-disulfide isomerase/thioredoxin
MAIAAAGLAGLSIYHLGAEFMDYRPNLPSTVDVAVRADGKSVSSDSSSFSILDQPRVLPAFRFTDEDSHYLSLADFRGRPVLLNIWATWCTPCRQEMPSLDRLQSAIGKSQLLVLPVSIDSQGAAAVKQFYQEFGLKALGVYLDPSGQGSRDLNTVGIPTTLLVDRDGREIGRKIGAADWDSPEMIVFFRKAITQLGAISTKQEEP